MDKNLQLYFNLHKLDDSFKSNMFAYNNHLKEVDRIKMAKFIQNNFARMNYFDKLSIHNKIVSEFKLNYELLKFQLTYLIPDEKITDFEKFIKETEKILNFYQWKAGGFLCEDDKWTLYRHGNHKYDLKENEVIFDNSVKTINNSDIEVYKYIKSLHNLLQKMTDSFKIKFRYIDDDYDDITWIIIRIIKPL